jgi:protocatechuate 3,4-dioxygenase beta subunit
MRGKCSAFALIVTTLFVLPYALGVSQPADQPDSVPAATPITLTGRVTDSQGRPVEGANVALYGMTYSEGGLLPKVEVIQEKATEADGTFSLTAAQGAHSYRPAFLIVRREGLALGWAMQRTQAEQRFDIVLDEPKDLTGEVVDEKGQPIADAEVSIAFAVMGQDEDGRVLGVPGFLKVNADGEGRFLFANMPAQATFEFLVRKPGRVTLSTFAQTISSDSLTALNLMQMVSGQSKCRFAPGQTGIRLTLPLEARIEGIVIEKSSGKPVGGVRVTVRFDERQTGLLSPDPVMTAQDGTFRICGLPAGNGSVQLATTRGWMVGWVAEPVPVSLKADETKSGVKVELTKGGIIEVLVREDNGKPIAKAGVNVSHAQRKQYFGGNTDEGGLARIRAVPGQYDVSAPSRPGYAHQTKEEHVTIEEGQTKRVEFILNVAARVAGTVRDMVGNPLDGVRIVVAPPGLVGVATNAEGEFVLNWDSGLPGYQYTAPVLVARDMARSLGEIVEIGEQTGRLDVRLKPGVTVVGSVQSQEGKPLSGARLILILRSSGTGLPSSLIDWVTTSGKGAFEIKAIPPGWQYELTATANGYGAQSVSIDASNLKDNRQDVGRFVLALANLSISGVVVDAQGQPVAGAEVSAFDRRFPPRPDVQTDAEGQFVIQGVPAGPISLMASTRAPKYRHGFVDASGGATGVRIVLSE